MADTPMKSPTAPAPAGMAAVPPTVTDTSAIVQVILDHDPQGTEAQLREKGMDLMKYGCCAESRRSRGVPMSERRIGCPVWRHCTLEKIKAKSGPINLPYRLYKKGGRVREGWGPCFAVFRMSAQYNHNENYVMEILPASATVGIPGSKLLRRPDNSEVWTDTVEEQRVPPFPRIGERGHRVAEQHAAEVRRKILEERAATDRRREFIDTTMKIGPDDEAPASPQRS